MTQDLSNHPMPILVEVSVDGMIELRSGLRPLSQIVGDIEDRNSGLA